ncbi:MAG TPA: transketolase [Candidatus Brocadiia bacterium]|nr:transketolase [Candidatus Brocadiia bacterium]
MRDKLEHLNKKAWRIRQIVMEMCVAAGTGHVTSSFSCAEILVALYHGGVLKIDPKRPKWEDRDRFILSKGQASPILYAVLADMGFFPMDHLQRFCKAGGPFGVHLQNDVNGVEITSGSLGIGFGVAAGVAYAARLDGKPHMTYALLGDGECYEGSVWETAMFAGHHRLTNLAVIVDRNQYCVTGRTEDIVHLEPLDAKWRAFGWDTVQIDGHSIQAVLDALDAARKPGRAQPLAILANTVKGKGVSFMENKALWHGVAPKGKDAEQALAELGAKT